MVTEERKNRVRAEWPIKQIIIMIFKIEKYETLFDEIGIVKTEERQCILDFIYQLGSILYNNKNLNLNKYDKEERTN